MISSYNTPELLKYEYQKDIEIILREQNVVFDKVADYYEGEVLARCKDPNIKEFKVKEGTVKIAKDAFIGCDNLEIVYIPNSVKGIGVDAFYQCKNLKRVIFEKGDMYSEGHEGIISIDAGAFSECPNLHSINLPDGLIRIGKNVFAECTSLKKLTLPESLNEIGVNPFRGCNINIKSKSTHFKVYRNLLTDCISLIASLKDDEIVKIPDYVQGINVSAFQDRKNLKIVILPKYLLEIAECAFYRCSNLRYVYTNGVVSCIAQYAFCDSGLISFTFPKKLEEIDDFAFSNCKHLTTVIKRGECKIVSSDDQDNPSDDEYTPYNDEYTPKVTLISPSAFENSPNVKFTRLLRIHPSP
ncbi:MAG: leucine-rich repeat domain-containing protein [Prevotella sp.]|nr:leucine-rich repeat domain-containing protein [Prevotella sp.]